MSLLKKILRLWVKPFRLWVDGEVTDTFYLPDISPYINADEIYIGSSAPYCRACKDGANYISGNVACLSFFQHELGKYQVESLINDCENQFSRFKENGEFCMNVAYPPSVDDPDDSVDYPDDSDSAEDRPDEPEDKGLGTGKYVIFNITILLLQYGIQYIHISSMKLYISPVIELLKTK